MRHSVARQAGAAGGIRVLRAVAQQVVIDLTGAHLWDITAVGALEGVVNKMRRHGLRVEVIGLNEASAGMVERHGRFSPAEM